MRRRVGTQWSVLRNPVDLMNALSTSWKQTSNQCKIQVLLQYFCKIPGHFKFKYDQTDTTWIDIETIITTVTLELNVKTDVYTLDAEDADALNQFVNENN